MNEDKKNKLNREIEADANKFNITVIILMALMSVACEVLNNVGVFLVDKNVMHIGMGIALIFLLIPISFYLVHDIFMKKETSIFYWPNLKGLIIGSVFIAVLSFNVALTNHSLILILVPSLVAAQYKNNKAVNHWVGVVSIVLVPIGVYGGYFLGSLDHNLVKVAADQTTATIAERWELAKGSGRMLSLFTHHVLPRALCVLAADALIIGILKRNERMIDGQLELTDQLQEQMDKTSHIQERIANNLAALIENRDVSTGEHVVRTQAYVKLICDELRRNPSYQRPLSEEEAALIIKAAPLHDVGKIKVSDVILKKPGKLTAEEYEEMKLHAVAGDAIIHSILDNIEESEFVYVADQMAVHHHEKWDGTGYPNRLKGEDIPLPARIMAVADVFDALVSIRVYKPPFPLDEAFTIIKDSSGTHFDPQIVKAFLNIRDKVTEVAKGKVEQASL